MKRVADDELFRPVQLQLWFQDSRERYRVLTRAGRLRRSARPAEPQLGTLGRNAVVQSQMSRAAATARAARTRSAIKQKFENWKAEKQGRRLRALQNVPAIEMDS